MNSIVRALSSEPVVTWAGVGNAVITQLAANGFHSMSPTTAWVLTGVGMVLALIARNQVSPVAKP